MNASRLLKLADHLESGNRRHATFDIEMICSGETLPDGSYCGTAGCALGELPACFPGSFYYHRYQNRIWVVKFVGDTTPWPSVFSSAAVFFGISNEAVSHLFQPGAQVPSVYGGNFLSKAATAKQVAEHIRDFVNYNKKPVI